MRRLDACDEPRGEHRQGDIDEVVREVRGLASAARIRLAETLPGRGVVLGVTKDACSREGG